MSGTRDLEEDAALPLEVDLAVVDRARDARAAEVLDHLVTRELDRRGLRCCGRRHGRRRWHHAGNLGAPVAGLEDLLHLREERRGVRAIVRPMIEGHREVPDRMYGDPVLAVRDRDGDWPHRHAVGRDDADLGLIDDRAGEERAVAAGVRDRERAAGQVVGGEPLGVRALREVGGSGRELGDRLALRVADHRHDEAFEVEVDRDAQVDRAVHDEVALDDRRVQPRELGEGVDDGTHHEGQIGQLGRSTHLVDRLVVDLDCDERVRRGAQRLREVLRGALADVAEGHDRVERLVTRGLMSTAGDQTGRRGGGGAGATGATGAAGAIGGAGAAGAGRAGSPTDSVITARRAPIGTVSPSATRISTISPATGDGTSASTLSVDTSSSGSSTPIRSPTCLHHRSTVPSVTVSPSCGIVMSTAGEPTLVSANPI